MSGLFQEARRHHFVGKLLTLASLNKRYFDYQVTRLKTRPNKKHPDWACQIFFPSISSTNMKGLQKITSIFILLALNLLLGAEAFGQNSRFDGCEISKAHASYQERHEEQGSANKCGGRPGDDKNKNCADPCHIGQIHFGHGSFPSSGIKIRYLSISSTVKPNQALLFRLDEPTLGGLRRPPRT